MHLLVYIINDAEYYLEWNFPKGIYVVMSSNLVDIRHIVNYSFGYTSYYDFLKNANDVYPEATKMFPAFVRITYRFKKPFQP